MSWTAEKLGYESGAVARARSGLSPKNFERTDYITAAERAALAGNTGRLSAGFRRGAAKKGKKSGKASGKKSGKKSGKASGKKSGKKSGKASPKKVSAKRRKASAKIAANACRVKRGANKGQFKACK